MLIFMRSLIKGNIFNDPATAEMMRSNWNQFGFLISPVAPGWPIEYGLGMMRYRNPRFPSIFMSVPEVIGHTGASSAWLFYIPGLDILTAGTVSQITAAAVPIKIIPKLAKILAEIQGNLHQN